MEPLHANSEAWLAEATRLNSAGQSARALDVVYETIDEWLRAGDFGRCEQFLADADAEGLPSRILLAILTVTNPAKERLKSREGFLDRAWRVMEADGKDVDRLLTRLRVKHGAPAKRPPNKRRLARRN